MAFYNISREEMEEFLGSEGFKPMKLPNTRELVFGKIIKARAGYNLSLRVYTAIEPTGESRAKGADAIRVQLYWMYQDQPRMVGKMQKCLRVTNWKQNLKAAIERQGDEEHYQTCPACNSPMVIREYKGSEFWGCATYKETLCNGKPKPIGVGTALNTVARDTQATAIKLPENKGLKTLMANPSTFTNPPKSSKPVNPYRIPDHQISSHQLAVEKYFNDETGNIIMGARAGSGKTTMLKHLASFRPTGKSMVYLAFGRKNATEGRKKLPREVPSLTTHKFCAGWLKDYIKLPEKPDKQKNWTILEKIYPGMKNQDRKAIRKVVFKLVGLAKNFAIRPGDMAGLKAVMDQYSFELDDDKQIQTALEVTNEVLEKSMPDKCGLIYDFDDMLWWPIVLDFKTPKWDYVLADECQDFNACQIELLKRLESRGTRVIGVGDPYQAVFRFRGADCDAYEKLKEMLGGTVRGCKELILPTNYRCPRSHIEYVQQTTIVKDIQASPNAIEGKVILDMSYLQVLELLAADNSKA